MLTPTLSGTIMRRQHGARNILNGASRRGPECCCLIIEYVMHGDCVACTISTEEQQNTGRSRRGKGGDYNLSKYCRLIKSRSKQIRDRWSCHHEATQHWNALLRLILIHSFVRSLTRSLIQSVNHSFRSDSERVTINLFSHLFLPLLFAVLPLLFSPPSLQPISGSNWSNDLHDKR